MKKDREIPIFTETMNHVAHALFQCADEDAKRTICAHGDADELAALILATLKIAGWETRLVFTRPPDKHAWHCYVEGRENRSNPWMKFDPYSDVQSNRGNWIVQRYDRHPA